MTLATTTLLQSFLPRLVTETFDTLRDSTVAFVPKLVIGLLFLTVAYAGVKILLTVVRYVLDGLYGEENDLIAQLFVSVIGVFLWFGVALTLLKIVGMGDIATSLGTAAGFIALGISYALSNMIADTVAGVYLLRDPDFNPGYRVTVAGTTGTVRSIELRKSRLELDDGDVIVMANRDVESRWTRKTGKVGSESVAGGGN